MNDSNTLRGQLDLLTKRGGELVEKQDLSADEQAEVSSLPGRIAEVKRSMEAAKNAETAKLTLKNSIQEVASFNNTVVKGGRPSSVTGAPAPGYYPQPGTFRVGVLDRKRLPNVELTEDDYVVLKKDGYSESTIQNCATDSYIDEFREYMRTGGRNLSGMILKSMTEGGAGGVLVPIQWGELITNPPMSGMLRSRVRNMAVNTLLMRFPRIQTTNVNYPAYPVKVTWGGEQPTDGQNRDQGNNFNTTNIDIQVNEVYAQGLFSISLLEDNAYSISSYIPTVFQESLDVDLDYRIIAGTGISDPSSPQPYGMNETGVVPLTNATTTGASAKIVYQDLVNLMYKLPQQYRANGVWLMNSQTLAAVAALVDQGGRPLFLPNYGYIGDMPGGGTTWRDGTILGRPFIISENMPNIGQGNVSLYFADFERLYFLLTRVGPTVRVLDQVQYTAGNYVFALRARYGGRVVQPWAGQGLKHV